MLLARNIRFTLYLGSAIFMHFAIAATTENITSYKNYLFLQNDSYSCDKLRQYRCASNNSNQNKLECVSDLAIKNCTLIANLKSGNMTLNDSYNQITAKNSGTNLPDIAKVSTLFAPYIMTYDPDYPNKNRIGKPYNNSEVQELGYQKILNKQPSCVTFTDRHGTFRASPYTSHCSAYAAWVSDKVFGVNIYPVQVGDWCHVAAEQRDQMFYDTANWAQVNSVAAQQAANQGKLVLAVFKKENKTAPSHQQNGHIAVVIPNVVKLSAAIQHHSNYPKLPSISSDQQFESFIKIYGPEVTQAGGLNFNHTVTANAFSSYYPAKENVGKQPVDQIIEFFVYNHKTQPEYDF